MAFLLQNRELLAATILGTTVVGGFSLHRASAQVGGVTLTSDLSTGPITWERDPGDILRYAVYLPAHGSNGNQPSITATLDLFTEVSTTNSDGTTSLKLRPHPNVVVLLGLAPGNLAVVDLVQTSKSLDVYVNETFSQSFAEDPGVVSFLVRSDTSTAGLALNQDVPNVTIGTQSAADKKWKEFSSAEEQTRANPRH